jgi:hypothetical protein
VDAAFKKTDPPKIGLSAVTARDLKINSNAW